LLRCSDGPCCLARGHRSMVFGTARAWMAGLPWRELTDPQHRMAVVHRIGRCLLDRHGGLLHHSYYNGAGRSAHRFETKWQCCCGAVLVILGFAMASRPQDNIAEKAAGGDGVAAVAASDIVANTLPNKAFPQPDDSCWRWHGWAWEHAAPLLALVSPSLMPSTADASSINKEQNKGLAAAGHPSWPHIQTQSPAAEGEA